MGNVAATLAWKPHPDDDEIMRELIRLREYRGLEKADDPEYYEGKTTFGAEIAGLSIPWEGGREAAKERVDAFADEALSFLRGFGAEDAEKCVMFLPM